MASNKLHLWPFHVWEGPPPNVSRLHVSNHNRPGTIGTSHTAVGHWGDPFTVRITSYYTSYTLALDAINRVVMPMLEQPLIRLWYGSVDYLIRYQTMYKVTDIQVIECQQAVRIMAAGTEYANGAILTVQVTMIPHGV